jgi:hypothetical protein
VTDSTARETYGPPGYLSLASRAGGVRYLLVRISLSPLSPCEAIPWYAHELQHAVEVARAPGVTDAGSMAQLYRLIGWEDETGRFESDHARAIGNIVRDELAGRRR